MMNKIACMLAGMMAAGGIVAMPIEKITAGGSGFELQDGRIYEIGADVTFAASEAGKSAMTVNGTAVLYIPKGLSLTVRGADGNGPTGGGAGISVASGKTLLVTGGGRLIATGGKGANGGTGSNGAVRAWDSANHGRTSGGAGGVGGGGAGAGIGTCGGTGGNGGAEKETTLNWSEKGVWGRSGERGNDGSGGASSDDMGTVYVLGGAMVMAESGSAGSIGAGGKRSEQDYSDGTTYRLICGMAGGGGGGGGGTMARCGIGAGGGGGGGGGSGGSAAMIWRATNKGPDKNNGYSVGGVHGNKSGYWTGEAGDGECFNGDNVGTVSSSSGSWTGGRSGYGGTYARSGNDGSVYVDLMASASAQPNRSALIGIQECPGVDHAVTIRFVNGAQEVAQAQAKLGKVMPVAPSAPTRHGYRFDGWWYADGNGGELCVYTADGDTRFRLSPYVHDVTLQAKWKHAESALTVNSPAMGTNVGEGKITLFDALAALEENPYLASTNGLAVIVFDLPEGENTIRWNTNVVIGASARSVTIDGYNGGRGVTIDGSDDIGTDSAITINAISARIKNCAFRNFAGARSRIIEANGNLTLNNCSFTGNGCREELLYLRSDSIVSGCSFISNNVNGCKGVLRLRMGRSDCLGLVINSTFLENTIGSADSDVIEYSYGVLIVANSTMINTTGEAKDIDVTPNFLAPTRPRMVNSFYTRLGNVTPIHSIQAGENLFMDGIGVRSATVDSVLHHYLVPLGTESVCEGAWIWYSYDYGSIAWSESPSATKNKLFGTASNAHKRFGRDEIGGLRVQPNVGAIAIAPESGMLLEGRYVKDGVVQTNASVTLNAKANYLNGTDATNSYVVATGNDGEFAQELLFTRATDSEATNVVITADGREVAKMSVDTTPCALVAACAAEVIADNRLTVAGDEVIVGELDADEVTVSGNVTAYDSFHAKKISETIGSGQLYGPRLEGGTMRWLSPKTSLGNCTTEGYEGAFHYSNLGYTPTGEAGTAKYSREWKFPAAPSDGFLIIRFQYQAWTANKKFEKVQKLSLMLNDNFMLFENRHLSEDTGFSGPRIHTYTIPICRGETATIMVTSGYDSGREYEVSGEWVQFGVNE